MGAVSTGGEGVLRPGCGSCEVACGGDVGKGESTMGMCSFECVMMADVGKFMLQEDGGF